MSKVVVIGGGFAGCAAAAAAAKIGARVTLLERMDVLGGCGLVAGRMGLRSTPYREERKLMGSDDMFQKTTNATPNLVISNCKRRLKRFDDSTGGAEYG